MLITTVMVITPKLLLKILLSIFDIGSGVSTILGLSGLATTCLFALLRSIIKNSQGNNSGTNNIYTRIINGIFIISILAMIFGFCGWILSNIKPNPSPDPVPVPTKTKLDFDLIDSSDRDKPLANVIVSALSTNTISNSAGHVTIEFDTPQKDSVHIIFLSDELGISANRKIPIKRYPDEFYLKVNKNNLVKRSFEISETAQSKQIIKSESVTLNDKSTYTDSEFGTTLKSLLYKVPFNSSINDVLSFEFGNSHPQLDYNTLPIAVECSPVDIHYYWRYLKDSKINTEVYSYLSNKGLLNLITNDTYIVYAFNDNRLIRIYLRFFSADDSFNKQFLGAVLNKPHYSGSEYITETVNDLYYASGSSYKDVKSFEILIATKDGFTECIHDWWHK